MSEAVYDNNINPRENKKYYISLTSTEEEEMLAELNLSSLEDLFNHIPHEVKFDNLEETERKTSAEIIQEIKTIANSNVKSLSFKMDELYTYSRSRICDYMLSLRNLTTSYTPYQAERSQGTLISHWIYQSLISQLSGFEAINSSFYDRASALFEAISCANKIKKNNKVLILDHILECDKEVLITNFKHTDIELVFFQGNLHKNGIFKEEEITNFLQEHDASCLVFQQINRLGQLEDCALFCQLAKKYNLLSISIIDIATIAKDGLQEPSFYQADMFVSEGQFLALDAYFGGPALGIFGIRYNQTCKNHIRSSAGRLVGDAFDEDNKNCKVLVLSTREQHIKREKANSNICSNQAYIATIAGANLLHLGEEGLRHLHLQAKENAYYFAENVLAKKDINLFFPNTNFYHQVLLELNDKVLTVYDACLKQNIELGKIINIQERKALLICFSDIHTKDDIDSIIDLFEEECKEDKEANLLAIDDKFLRKTTPNMPSFSYEELVDYYQKLANQNMSPDSTIYPLGSCTMKYNPYLNDYCASFSNFQTSHPQSNVEFIQGNLATLYYIQEYFMQITNLAGVCTQAVSGAQGELIGLKMFQAYHQDNSNHLRDIILIPASAHGTNPASAKVAGFKYENIVLINADEQGLIDVTHIEELVAQYTTRIAGIMITNPNTSGLFEKNFKKIADLIHQQGGLVYMDGANMNAIACWIDLDKMGVDAVHNNLHKTWSIPHGGGGPGDGIVAVSKKLVDYIPSIQVKKEKDKFIPYNTKKSIGSFHRHFGNFAHKIRCYTYLLALGTKGIKKMSAIAVLSARYIHHKLKEHFVFLPINDAPVMHEFILTLDEQTFASLQDLSLNKAQIISRFGKLFLDFGFHAPTVSFPEVYGLMIEPTESYTKEELDRFIEAIICMKELITSNPKILLTVPHFTPIKRIDEIKANRKPVFSEKLTNLPKIWDNRIELDKLHKLSIQEIKNTIIKFHQEEL